MKSIAVLGQGFVGGSLTTVFTERGQRVYVFDKMGKVAQGGIDILTEDFKRFGSTKSMVEICDFRSDKSQWNIKNFVVAVEHETNFSGIFFVCVPTPMKKTGEADLSIVESVLQELADAPNERGKQRIAVIKSTVPPGTTQHWNDVYGGRLHVIFNPEFLTEANALDDMRNQDRIILGGPRPWINNVKMIFQHAFPKVPIVKTSSTTAEMVKYVTNIHLMVKVALANEFAQICEALDKSGKDIDYDKVIEYATKDKRLGTSHWQVPGPDGKRGGGGSCVPGNTLVALSTGAMTISELYTRFKSGEDHSVISFTFADASELKGKTTSECSFPMQLAHSFKRIIEVTKNPSPGKLLVFHFGDKTFTCTREHLMPIFRNGTYQIVEAQDVCAGDEFIVDV